ncbi:6-phosphogluconolactonase [uncultured Roseobacter sp.]|uniref:6-phosphogluconolactonase n=1 Tax=uncultured Roseobacter sp. TaxID=114847 RepID=UPI00260200FF|nr:6-phosphogluconolactonase [uncultured Roseobacter sp.]
MIFNENADRDMAVMNVAHAITSDLRKCLLQHEVASFAVPGGTTPGPVFDAMSTVDIDWSRVHVMLTDERWVPEDHPRSNTALVKERLLTGRAAAAHFFPFYREGMTAEEAAPVLSAEIASLVPVSVLLLGMGTDMHTASLFPDAPGLDAALDRNAPHLVAMQPDSQPEARISLSGPLLEGAMDKHLIIFGEDKKEALQQAMKLPANKAPVSVAIKGGQVHWAA